MHDLRHLMKGRLSVRTAGLLALLTVGALSCDGNPDLSRPGAMASAPSGQMPAGQNILLIVVDALRADRLGCYGYSRRPTSPAIDALAKESIVFDSFRAAAPWTAPAFGTILTGVLPDVHQAGPLHPAGEEDGVRIGPHTLFPIHKNVSTIAQLLPDHQTAAIVNNAYLHRRMGYARGFDLWNYQVAKVIRHRLADRVSSLSGMWLKRNGNRPFFLMVHYMDPHLAYNPPRKYHEAFLDRKPGRYRVPYLRSVRSQKPLGDRELPFMKSAYDGEIRFTDDEIGRLLRQMQGMKLLDNTWVVVTADHGEEHFDHGGFEHGHALTEEVVRVPLIIRAPGGRWGAGHRVSWSAGQADLVPTFLQWMGKETPDDLQGRSLVPLITGKEAAHRSTYSAHLIYGEQQESFFDGRYKLIRHKKDKKRARVFDLVNDPLEKLPLDSRSPAAVRLTAQLERFLKQQDALIRTVHGRNPPSDPSDTDPDGPVALPEDVQDSLRSLGYIE